MSFASFTSPSGLAQMLPIHQNSANIKVNQVIQSGFDIHKEDLQLDVQNDFTIIISHNDIIFSKIEEHTTCR
jgi:hypothetical protein